MFKSIQIKIILILIAISLIMIIGTGMLYIKSLEETKENIQEQEIIQEEIENAKTTVLIVSISFTLIRSDNNYFFFKNDNSTNSKAYK